MAMARMPSISDRYPDLGAVKPAFVIFLRGARLPLSVGRPNEPRSGHSKSDGGSNETIDRRKMPSRLVLDDYWQCDTRKQAWRKADEVTPAVSNT